MFPMIGKDRGPGGRVLEDFDAFEVKFEMRMLIVAKTKKISSERERKSIVIGLCVFLLHGGAFYKRKLEMESSWMGIVATASFRSFCSFCILYFYSCYIIGFLV